MKTKVRPKWTKVSQLNTITTQAETFGPTAIGVHSLVIHCTLHHEAWISCPTYEKMQSNT